MPKNKNAYLRYTYLDSCFRKGSKGRNLDFRSIMDYVNEQLENQMEEPVKKSILYSDIKFMINQGAPIEKITAGGRVFYRYTNPEYHFGQLRLYDEELEQLQTLIDLLDRFNALPEFGFMGELILKLQSHFNLRHPENQSRVVLFDTNTDIKGIEYLPGLLGHILKKQSLIIDYRTFRGNKSGEYLVHPYLLKQYNGRWFLMAYNQTADQLWTMALDRIFNIQPVDSPFLPSGIDWEEYFYDIIGVSVPKDEDLTEAFPVETITVRFSESMIDYIRTKPLHPSQKIRVTEAGEYHVQYRLIPNYELIQTLLQFGEQAEVISPLSVRNTLRERIARMYKIYEASANE
ncbi:MAG: WYL domain-containing protein [Bacteroidia bacterium]|nr:WYL domain-containing protein [Bacteroidia bacterium]